MRLWRSRWLGSTCWAVSYTHLPEFQDKAKLTLVSATSIVEGGAHDVLLKDKAPYASNTR